MILKDRQQNKQEKLQDLKFLELLMNQQLQLLLMDLIRKMHTQLQFMIWEEELLIFQFLNLEKEFMKLNLQMEIPILEEMILIK